MARAVLRHLGAVAFSRPNCPPFGGSTLKRVLSVSHLILPLLALASATCLSAQTIVVDKATLTFSGQFGGSAVTQTINVTSPGASIAFTLVPLPTTPQWLKVSEQGVTLNTPAVVTVTADPTGLPAGTYQSSIAVLSSSSNPSIAVTFTVSAIGVSPASLASTYTFGSGTFPAQQSLTLIGPITQCTATVANTSGGSWFFVPQTACTSPGNVTVVFNNAIIAGLAPNKYSGTITITPVPAGQSPAVVVPVTLTVLPTPPVTVNPPSLFFNWQTGVAEPNPSQTFTISTTAGQALNYSFTKSVDAGNWISTVDPPSGSISSTTGNVQITVTLNPDGLATGTYRGRLTLLTPGGSPTQQDIPVQLVVSNAPLLNVPNATLSFTGQVGSTPPAQTVKITATSGTLLYTVTQSANSQWLIVPTAGITTAPLSVSVNPAGLTAQTEPYVATVSVTPATPGSAAQQFKVALTITNDPTITASVTALSFPFQIGQSAPVAVRSVKLTSLTGVALNYTATLATTTCGSTWLQAANANNSLAGVTDDILKVSIAPAGLTAGTCNGTITIHATNQTTGAAALGSPLTITVTLFVSTGAQLVLTPPDPPVFTVGTGGQSPPVQTIGLSSTGTDVLTYTVAFQSQGGWLSLNTVGGTTSVGNSLAVSVNSIGLTAGTYAGTITITATGPGGAAVANSPVTVPVTLNVTAGSLTLSSSTLTFAQTLGGPAPVAQTVTVGSSGQPLNYTAVANSNNAVSWLSVSPANGNTASAGILTVTVDGSKLAAGVTYNGTIQVTSPGAGNSPATINVQFNVAPGTLSAPTATLTFTQAAGGPAPLAQTIAVTGSPAPLSFTAAAGMLNGAGWLSVTPASGATPSSVQVSVNGAALPVAQYIGSVTLTSTGATGSPISVPVVLNVVAPAVLAASPTSLSFAYNIGQSAPAPLSVQVSATGVTNVPLSAKVQYDGAAGQTWLAVTPATATTPAAFSVSVGPGSLAPGKYAGSVVITSAYALVATTIPVTLTVAAIPTPVAASVANAASYATGAVSPGENIVIFGTGIGPADLVKATVPGDTFPTLVGATRVLFDGTPAPVLYASATQTSVMVPYGINGRTSTNIVVEYSGVQSVPVSQAVVATVPGIYTLNQAGSGPGAILNHDLTVNGLTNPEKRGSFIAIYMTGEGQTNPGGVDGFVIPPVVSALKRPVLPVTVTIGGVDAHVEYAGSAASLISGVMQVNVTIPATAPTGTQPVVVTVGTVKSQSGAGAATVVVQ
jgi:uncharacterized protein (TIGR03437 family)